MILFQRGNFKIGKRRGHFIGDPTLSNRADGDLLIIDLFFVSILHFTPNIKLTNAIKRLVVDKLDFSWHTNVSAAKRIAEKQGYAEGQARAEKERQHYYDLCQKHEKELNQLRRENGNLKEAFRILANDKAD